LPSREESALIKVSVEVRRTMPLPYRTEQQRMLALYQAKVNLDKAISLLGSF
jgi:hypothetical protein